MLSNTKCKAVDLISKSGKYPRSIVIFILWHCNFCIVSFSLFSPWIWLEKYNNK